MSLYGVIAGIQGNREALAAVLDALDKRSVRRIVCLGDLVGCNADPDECVEMVRRRCAAVIAGTHDLIALGRLGWQSCSTWAEYSLRRTRRALSAASRSYLAALPASALFEDGIVLAHLGADAAALRARFPGVRVCFSGDGAPQKEERIDGLHFLSPGSVDASRRRGRLAECALFDTLERSAEFLRVPYDSAASEAKAAVFGYRINPLTDRLYTLRRRTASAARLIGARLHRGGQSGR